MTEYGKANPEDFPDYFWRVGGVILRKMTPKSTGNLGCAAIPYT